MSKRIPLYPVRNLKPRQKEAVKRFGWDTAIEKEEIACIICQSREYHVLFKNERHGIDQNTVMCRNCGLVYSNPRMKDDSVHYFYGSDLYREIYHGVNDQSTDHNLYNLPYQFDKEGPSFEKYYYQLFFDFIHQFDLSYKSVCEIGAAGGWNLAPFLKMGKRVKGYEPSPMLVKQGLEKGIDLENGFVDDVEGVHDLVILKHVLEHFQNPLQVLTNLHPHVGKYLFIEVPGIETRMPSLQNAHTFYFSTNTLEYITAKAGYKKLRLEYSKSNDFIFGLFEKTGKEVDFSYSHSHERFRVQHIYKNFTKALFRARFMKNAGVKKLYRFIKKLIGK